MNDMMEQATRDLTPEELAAMDAAFEVRDIEVITEEINFYKRQAGSAILEIGKRLAEAKEQLSHGEWLPWLDREVEFSERSAQQYMRLWKEYGKSATVADLGCSKALILLGLPASEREEFTATSHTVNGEEKTVLEMTRRELEEAIAARNDARAEAERATGEAEDARDAAAEARQELERAQQELQRAAEELETLKSRPVEVAVEKVDATEEQLAAARKAAEEETRLAMAEEARSRVAELEERLKALGEKEKAAQEAAEQAKDAAMSYKAEAEAAKKAAAMTQDDGTARFKVLFDQTVENVNSMASLLGELPDSRQEKLRRALLALADAVRKAAG